MPAVVPELVRVWAIIAPLDAVAPDIPPVIAPMVQLKVAHVTLLARVMLVAVTLQIIR